MTCATEWGHGSESVHSGVRVGWCVWGYQPVYLVHSSCSLQLSDREFLWWANRIPARLCLSSTSSHQYKPSIADCPHQHYCLLLTVTGLTQWGICASHRWSGGKVEQYSKGGGKLAVFSFFARFSLQISVTESRFFPRRNPIISLWKSGQSAHR